MKWKGKVSKHLVLNRSDNSLLTVWSSPEGGDQQCIRSPFDASSISCHKNESVPRPGPHPAPPQPEHPPGCVSNEWCVQRDVHVLQHSGMWEERRSAQPNSLLLDTAGSHPLQLDLPRCQPRSEQADVHVGRQLRCCRNGTAAGADSAEGAGYQWLQAGLHAVCLEGSPLPGV